MKSRHVVFAIALCLTGCPDDPDPVDAGRDAGPGVDAGPVILYPSCEQTMPPGTTALPPVASTLIGSILPDNVRSVPGPMNPASERGEMLYRDMGYDGYTRGPAVDRILRTELGGTTPPATGRRSIAYFVHMADTQLVDDESPTRLGLVDTATIPGGLRAQEAYLPRAMSAMSRTLARIERTERPYDFGIVAGDCADSAQENEMRWFIDTMNGAAGIHTDSGEDDDLIPGPDNDSKDPFDATPFPAPWLFVPGNHDVLVVGISLPDSRLIEAAIGTDPVSGTRDYSRRYGEITTRSVPADPARRLLDRRGIVDMLVADTAGPGPVGHGYEPAADVSRGANYEYDAIPELLRVITLDTNDDTGGATGLVHRPAIDDFLIPALTRAQTEGLLVVVAMHHSTSAIDVFEGQLGATAVPDAVSGSEIESTIAGFDNVVAVLVGHNHDNRVRPITGPGGARPGYWEIMAAAISDFPANVRVIEIVDNGDSTLSLFATLVDFDEDNCAERRFRRLSVIEHVAGWGGRTNTIPSNLNVELLLPLPASAAMAVSRATGADRIESETTLRGDP